MSASFRAGIVLLPLVVAFVSSCVIHDEFPYICFLPDCVGREYNIKGITKPIKARMALKARRRENARMKAGKKAPQRSRDVEDQRQYSSRVIYTKYIGTFEAGNPERTCDTIIFFHTSETNRITENDCPRLEHFLRMLPAKKVQRVFIRQVAISDSTEDKQTITSRERQIRKFLKQNGVRATATFFRPYVTGTD